MIVFTERGSDYSFWKVFEDEELSKTGTWDMGC